MQQRLPSLLDPPIAFAHRGARAHAPENTIEAFQLALKLGATGLESDVWTTADGVPVLDHDGVVKRGLRRTSITDLDRDRLPDHIPTLDDMLAAGGATVPLSLDVKDGVFDTVAEVIRRHGHQTNTWLCHPSFEAVCDEREPLHDVRLVHSFRLSKLEVSPEQHAARVSAAGLDAVNMHHTDWNGGLVVMFHKFDVYAFAWGLRFDYEMSPAIRMGLDAIYSDHTDVMVDVLAHEVGHPEL